MREPRLAKVRQPDLPVVVQQHVGRFQITVQDSAAVSVDQRLHHFRDDLDCFAHRHRAVAQQLLQGPTLEVLHDVVRRRAVPAHIDQLNNVPVGIEKGQFFNFPVQQPPVQASAVLVKLNGDQLSRAFLPGQPNRSVRPGAQAAQHIVARQTGRRVQLTTQPLGTTAIA